MLSHLHFTVRMSDMQSSGMRKKRYDINSFYTSILIFMPIMKAIFVFLTLTLTTLLLFSCGESETPEIRTSGVVREDILDYGPNLFFPYRILFQYNRLTNTVTRLCPDPECNGNCPLDAFVDFPHFIDENNLYFTAIDYNLHILHAYMNILTGEVKVLRDLSQAEDPFGSYILSSDGEYVWYQAKLLKEGGNKNNTKDYETWLCRMPKTGGAEERIFQFPLPYLSFNVLIRICRSRKDIFNPSCLSQKHAAESHFSQSNHIISAAISQQKTQPLV